MNTLKYFLNLPEESLVLLATHSWEDLEMMCYALTLDLYFAGKDLQD
jgi:hypothetical protein